MRYRIEKDQLGELQVPAEAYYGIETLRGKENFEITKRVFIFAQRIGNPSRVFVTRVST